MKPIASERLLIDQANVNDAPFILKLFNDPGWIEFVGNKGMKTLADARIYIEEKLFAEYDRWGFGFFVVKLKESMTPVGFCGLRKADYLDHVDIGFGLLSQYHGNGYACEAASAVLKNKELSFGLKKVVAIVESGNVNSVKVIERIGLRFEKTIDIPGEQTEFLLYS